MRRKPLRQQWQRVFQVVLASALVTVVGCGRQPEPVAPVVWPQISGYEAMKIPADNPMSVAKVELGKQLYYDTRLSGDGSRACYSCHLRENGLTDGKPTAVGAYGVALPRASPTLWNIGYHAEYYWDGRSNALEAQARAAWSGGNMGVTGLEGRPSMADIAARLNQIAGYRNQFRAVFNEDATPENVVKAIAAFERTLVSNQSAWIRFREGNESALSEQARRGYQLFSDKAKCTNCHAGLLLTDLQYHNTGIGTKAAMPDPGRFRVTQMPRDRSAFKTPTLLDISKSAPYFHDGSVATLEEAVNLMLNGGIANPDLDRTNLEAVRLTDQEKADLLAFLRALDVEYNVVQPTLPQ